MLAARQSGIFLQLIGAVERGRIGGGRKVRADAISIDRRIGLFQCHEPVLVETAAREDRHVGKPTLIENAPHAFGKRNQIAAVEAHAADTDTGSLQPRRKRHDLSGRGLGVVGIDQEDQAVRPSVRKSLEGIGLVVVGLDVGMRHRAENRDIEKPGGEHRGGAGKAGNVACAGGK